MTAGGGDDASLAAGGPARHIPVLLEEVLAALSPQPGGLYLDATFGAGGYSRSLLDRGGRVLALDRDPQAILAAQRQVDAAKGALVLVEARFSALQTVSAAHGFSGFDGVTFDVGVSSMQIDEAARGFSFRHDGPLDMRMASVGESAADIVNGGSAERLADILYHYGEERQARRIARAIVHDREAQPFTSTLQLAGMVARVAPAKPTEIHPATRTFQALRIAVNDELGELVNGLVAAEAVLAPGGRLAVVTFHSLEDRIVKQFFAARASLGKTPSRLLPGEPARREATFTQSDRHVISASQHEIAANPRARSAKLRWAQRTHGPARGVDAKLQGLASLPNHNERRR